MTTYLEGPVRNLKNPNARNDWYQRLPVQFDPAFVSFFDDFTGVALDATNDWTVIVDSSATVAIAADTVNGVALFTSTTTTDNDGGSIQGNEVFALQSGKRLWFEARAYTSDANDSEWEVGLTENFVTNPEAMNTANRITLGVNEGSADIKAISVATSTTQSDSGVDAADSTFVTLGFYWDGDDTLKYYVNGAEVAEHNQSNDNIPVSNLTPGMFHVSGNDTGQHTAGLDYILVVCER